MEEHESNIGARDEAADMGIGRGVVVDDFEPHVWLEPLDLFDNIKSGVDDELIHVA